MWVSNPSTSQCECNQVTMVSKLPWSPTPTWQVSLQGVSQAEGLCEQSDDLGKRQWGEGCGQSSETSEKPALPIRWPQMSSLSELWNHTFLFFKATQGGLFLYQPALVNIFYQFHSLNHLERMLLWEHDSPDWFTGKQVRLGGMFLINDWCGPSSLEVVLPLGRWSWAV